MTDPATPEQPDQPALSRQDAARLLAERIVNGTVEESGDIAHAIVDRTRARQDAAKAHRERRP